jgi:hypothetical protein
MEKRGEIKPGITPPENDDTAATVNSGQPIKLAEEDSLRAIRELDGDFRKCAAEATRKSLR